MPVPSIAILKFLSSARSSFGWSLSKVDIFVLYVSEVDFEEFLQILTFMMFATCSSYNSTLIRGTGGGSIQACTAALIHG